LTARAVQLRASLVWRDEVMGDLVLPRPRSVTIGTSPKCTFVIPDVGLPPKFKLIKPGNRGYLLTLGHRMRGTLQVDGVQKDVAEFVRRRGEGEPSADPAKSFRATPIGGRDWGVIDLDESGDFKLFFQFVPIEAPLPRMEVGRYREVVVIGAVILAAALAFPSYSTVIVLAAMFATAIFEIVLGFLRAGDDDFTRPAIAFSVVLFALLLGGVYMFKLPADEDPWVPPGPRELTAGYLVDRLIAPPTEPEPPRLAQQPAVATAPVAPRKAQRASKAASQRDAGASGGLGKERATDPDVEQEGPPPPDKGLFSGNNRRQVDRVRNLDNLPAMNLYTGLKGPKKDGDAGTGNGGGTGAGDDPNGSGTRKRSKSSDTGGGGNAEGDFVASADIDPVATRAPRGSGGTGAGSGVKEAKVAFSDSSGDFSGGLSREEVERIVKSRKGTIQACYQKAVNRDRGLAGKLVVNFRIDAQGAVTSARVEPGKSTLRNAEMESCVKRQIQGLKFPAKGGAVVNYPFIFLSG